MKIIKFLPVSFLYLLCLNTPVFAQSTPRISSGEVYVNSSTQGCLARADRMLQKLRVRSTKGKYHRTGHYRDGVFRVVCFPTRTGRSIAMIFAAHNNSQSVANSFINRVLKDF
ncbi:MAG: hypothetical protein AAF378_22460 [Cyanobacteria bacterium P01_A01_bin.84]